MEAIEARFEQLYHLDLIALPDEFYQEAKPYDDVNHLERKLVDMEETNLQLISSNQEITVYSEAEDKRYISLKAKIGQEAAKLKLT